MTIDINKIPRSILEDLQERGLSQTDIKNSSVESLFYEWCEWNGFINWGHKIFYTLAAIKDAEINSIK